MYLLAMLFQVFHIIILPTAIFTKIMCQHISPNIRLVPKFSAPTHSIKLKYLFTFLILKPLRFILSSYFSRIPKIRKLFCIKMSWQNYAQKQKKDSAINLLSLLCTCIHTLLLFHSSFFTFLPYLHSFRVKIPSSQLFCLYLTLLRQPKLPITYSEVHKMWGRKHSNMKIKKWKWRTVS